ncbi:uncharacterized protein LOC133888018 [Phragmites australis]|uniref:uncharacterized protein LOC133888018 n=1 Tax=Phragmites australis TaxID=29695 RepID=UPI002D76B78F|nr:uncharacterized protein LOC133888018 [Phragmites australis]
MGNLVSHCVAMGARALVVGPDGCRSWLDEHTGVAELMINAQGHMVARATDVATARRVRAMAADELLRASEVYLLVPAGRAGARLGDSEVEAIRRLVSGKKKSRKSRPGSKVFPRSLCVPVNGPRIMGLGPGSGGLS